MDIVERNWATVVGAWGCDRGREMMVPASLSAESNIHETDLVVTCVESILDISPAVMIHPIVRMAVAF